MWTRYGPKMWECQYTEYNLTGYVQTNSGRWDFMITGYKSPMIIERSEFFLTRKSAQTACDELIANWTV